MIVALQGGLGNQMFQYAFGKSVSQARKESVQFVREQNGPRAYSLGAFNVEIQFLPALRPPIFYENPFAYNPIVYDWVGQSFSGHWQTERYFNVPLVRSHMKLRERPSEQSSRVADIIRAAGPWSAFLHIRRTDYVGANEAYHGMPSRNYYDRAIELIRQHHGAAKFFVFSDEPDWCRANFPEFTIVDHNKPGNKTTPGKEHEDIWLMSLCRHAIIANSSFSWWGAWLGDEQPNRIVIGPTRWFAKTDLESKDIIPERWLKYEN
jgi:hypothetical protein